MRVEAIDSDFDNLNCFLTNAGSSLKKFRYFSTRDVEVIRNHIYTILLTNDNSEPVAYGHLDPEDNKVWLGICVSEKFINQGLGSRIMASLTEKADSIFINELYLQVDIDNVSAVNLYKKFNFEIIENKHEKYFVMKRINENG
jgi:ribosomal protein S18 acetylase RimI-like enzyme